jgi:hypothetical protein
LPSPLRTGLRAAKSLSKKAAPCLYSSRVEEQARLPTFQEVEIFTTAYGRLLPLIYILTQERYFFTVLNGTSKGSLIRHDLHLRSNMKERDSSRTCASKGKGTRIMMHQTLPPKKQSSHGHLRTRARLQQQGKILHHRSLHTFPNAFRFRCKLCEGMVQLYPAHDTVRERERASLGSQQVPNRISIITSHIKLAGESKYTNITYLVLVYCVAERR